MHDNQRRDDLEISSYIVGRMWGEHCSRPTKQTMVRTQLSSRKLDYMLTLKWKVGEECVIISFKYKLVIWPISQAITLLAKWLIFFNLVNRNSLGSPFGIEPRVLISMNRVSIVILNNNIKLFYRKNINSRLLHKLVSLALQTAAPVALCNQLFII